jgi:hypothetical protein
MQDDSAPDDVPLLSDDETDFIEDDDHGSWVSMEDDDDVFIGHDNSDSSLPGLESAASSDDDSHDPSAGYTTSSQDHRHPGHASCHVVETPSSVESSGTFAEEVEGRLPYAAYVSEREYEYDGVLLDEERILGITVRVFGGHLFKIFR